MSPRKPSKRAATAEKRPTSTSKLAGSVLVVCWLGPLWALLHSTGSILEDADWWQPADGSTVADGIAFDDKCSIDRVDVTGWSLETVSRVLAGRRVPLLLTGLPVPTYSRAEFLSLFGEQRVAISGGAAYAKLGPELAVGVEVGVEGGTQSVHELVTAAGWAASAWSLVDWAKAMRDGRAASINAGDAYCFHNVTGVGPPLEPSWLVDLWQLADGHAQHATVAEGAAHPYLHITRVSLGANGSGTGFHQHGAALAMLLGGSKRWYMHRASRQIPPPGERRPWLDRVFVEQRINQRTRAVASSPDDWKGALVTPRQMSEWARDVYADAAFQRVWRLCDACWECTQRAGELMYVPSKIAHATLNVGEALGVAITNSPFD